MTGAMGRRGQLRLVTVDGCRGYELRCPECGQWGALSDRQLHGLEPVDHRGERDCTLNEARDWLAEAVLVNGSGLGHD